MTTKKVLFFTAGPVATSAEKRLSQSLTLLRKRRIRFIAEMPLVILITVLGKKAPIMSLVQSRALTVPFLLLTPIIRQRQRCQLIRLL